MERLANLNKNGAKLRWASVEYTTLQINFTKFEMINYNFEQVEIIIKDKIKS